MRFINKASIPSSEITPERIYADRRRFLAQSGCVAASLMLPGCAESSVDADPSSSKLEYLPASKNKVSGATSKEPLTPFEDVIRYNNFYEFGTDKGDPALYAKELTTDPWSLAIEGEVEKPVIYTLEDILGKHTLEERIYRLRCVEAWSMVIPWIGFSLADLLSRAKPTSRAKYVYFETLHRPDEMRGQRSLTSTIDWPYVEGLRIDEAMHPLTLMSVGLYGKTLLPQNGAPIRLVVPWKYGFKSIKSIVKIRLTEKQPGTTWQSLAPEEYGFYANVNPAVDHPRWSQKTERRLPSSLFNTNQIATTPFNGYGEQVAHLYKGMDLERFY
jgi:sulfoxide reductase catalytic subunit YedY